MFKCVRLSCHPSLSRCGCRSTLDWCDLRTHEWRKGVWVYSSGYFWLTLQLVLFKSHCFLFWSCTGILLYCTYGMCIGSCPTARLQKHILYLLKWTLRLQLFSHFFCPTLTPPGMAERVLPPDGFLLPGSPGKTCTFSKQLQLASLGQECSYNPYCPTSVL